MFESVLSLMKQYNTIILHRHSKPDGDAMGSQIGLKLLIEANYPDKRVLCVGDGAGRYAFMQKEDPEPVTDQDYCGALAIILDTSARALISDDRYPLAEATARIDHHIFCEKIADAEVVDTSFESCCGLVTQFALESGLRLNALAAKSLYTGMVTDSGRFRYDGTTARTFRLASALMEAGIDTNALFRDLYADDFASKQLKAKFILKIQFTPCNVAFIYTDLAEFRELGLDTFTVSRAMVNTMADIKGVSIWVNFTETEQGVLCEIRSNRYNINPVAV